MHEQDIWYAYIDLRKKVTFLLTEWDRKPFFNRANIMPEVTKTIEELKVLTCYERLTPP